MSTVPLQALAIMALCATSIALILYPIEFRLEFTPIQSIDAIPTLWLFIVLVLIWMGLLLALLWLTNEPRTTLALVACFGLVYFSFWTLRQPDGFLESWAKMQGVQVLATTGRLEPSSMVYAEWPGTALLGAFVAQVAGREIASLNVPLVLAIQIAVPICLFVFYYKILGGTRAAGFAVMAAIMANPTLNRFHFHPFWIALVPFLAGLIILLSNTIRSYDSNNNAKVLLILSAGLTIFHIYTAWLLFILAAALPPLNGWRKLGFPVFVHPIPILMVMAIFPLYWQMYWYNRAIENAISFLPALILMDQDATSLFHNLKLISTSNTIRIPLWANATRLGWQVIIQGLGTVVAIWVLLRRSSLAPRLQVGAAWPLAAIGMGVLATVTSTGGEEFRRLLMYGSILVTPVLIAWLGHLMGSRLGLILVSVALVAVSVPSFLVNGNLASTGRFYPAQRAAGEFLAQINESDRPGEGLALHNVGSAGIGLYYLPFASWERSPAPSHSTTDPSAWTRSRYERMGSRYKATDPEIVAHVIWIDPSTFERYAWLYGRDRATYVIEPIYAVVNETTLFFDNGIVQLWTSVQG